MTHAAATIEAVIRVAGPDDQSADIAKKLQAIVDAAAEDSGAGLDIEHWQPIPQRGSLQRVFLTSVGLVGLTRSSISGFSKVMNEVVAVFGDTADADVLTLEIGEQIFPLSEVTDEMIESWLPQPTP